METKHRFIKELEQVFMSKANKTIAEGQNKYMRNQFAHFGIKTPVRREISKPFLQKGFLPSKTEAFEIAKILYLKKERDYHHFALDLLRKYTGQLEVDDIQFFEFLITTNSWWDTVDTIAPKLVSAYFKKFPKQRDQVIDHWKQSGNIWLQRSCIIFQLMAKEKMDTKLLKHVILQLKDTKEFFLNKAIGWILRDYSRTNPEWVIEFCNSTKLNSLSRREALRLL